jgi:hypothetical protein
MCKGMQANTISHSARKQPQSHCINKMISHGSQTKQSSGDSSDVSVDLVLVELSLLVGQLDASLDGGTEVLLRKLRLICGHERVGAGMVP